MRGILGLIILVSACYISTAQTIIQRDPAIDSMVKEVSADSLKSYIYKMVSFGTRNTLSAIKDKNRGIGAARNWVLSKFNEFAKQSNGHLTAFADTITYQADKRRVDRAINLGNVVATLKGSDANDNRIYIISGHLDNMRSSPTDSIGDAPGALILGAVIIQQIIGEKSGKKIKSREDDPTIPPISTTAF
jgi:hypothetical protein